MFDCHLHSSFSTDSKVNGEAYCQKAIEKGFAGIILTDHLDYDFPGFEDQFQFDQEEYSLFIEKLKEKYRKELKLLKGIEVGIQPHVIDKTNEILDKYSFDYILCSVHVLDGIDPYDGEYYNGKTKYQAYLRYLEEILFAITHFDNFDMLGHIEYIVRNAHYDDKTLRYHDFFDILDMIFTTLISKGRGIEINAQNFRNMGTLLLNERSESLSYDLSLLKRYKELGGELLCLGSDAHSLENIGYRFEYFAEVARTCGFKYFAHFENRKPVFLPI